VDYCVFARKRMRMLQFCHDAAAQHRCVAFWADCYFLRTMLEKGPRQPTKVFWFFFSKKNIFLPLSH